MLSWQICFGCVSFFGSQMFCMCQICFACLKYVYSVSDMSWKCQMCFACIIYVLAVLDMFSWHICCGQVLSVSDVFLLIHVFFCVSDIILLCHVCFGSFMDAQVKSDIFYLTCYALTVSDMFWQFCFGRVRYVLHVVNQFRVCQ